MTTRLSWWGSRGAGSQAVTASSQVRVMEDGAMMSKASPGGSKQQCKWPAFHKTAIHFAGHVQA